MSNIFVYGSCVSRDALNSANDQLKLLMYVARQSLISGMSTRTQLLAGAQLESAFQNRMLEGDLRSDVLPRILGNKESIDLLLIDLTDERLGVNQLNDGSFVTHSVELVKSKRLNVLGARPPLIEIGTPDHWKLWTDAATRFYRAIDQAGLREKTLVLNTPWASESIEGEPVPLFRGTTSETMSANLAKCGTFIQDLGFKVLTLPDELAVTTSSHQWGIAQYHYGERAYEWILQQILEHLK